MVSVDVKHHVYLPVGFVFDRHGQLVHLSLQARGWSLRLRVKARRVKSGPGDGWKGSGRPDESTYNFGPSLVIYVVFTRRKKLSVKNNQATHNQDSLTVSYVTYFIFLKQESHIKNETHLIVSVFCVLLLYCPVRKHYIKNENHLIFSVFCVHLFYCPVRKHYIKDETHLIFSVFCVRLFYCPVRKHIRPDITVLADWA